MRLPLSSLMERLRGRMRERGAAFVLALAIEILIVLLLIFMAPVIPGKKKGEIPTVFGFDPGASEEAQDASPEQAQEQQAKSGKAQPAPQKQTEPPPPQEQPPLPDPPVRLPPNIVPLSRPDYRAADITGKGSEPRAADSGQAADAGGAAGRSGRMPGDSEVVGKAPNGEPLYRAEWYRRPTNAELQPYISQRARGPGFGIVACRMVPSYRVEDCQVIGEGPGGYGYGGAVRQASFQFRVRPPRVGGKEMYGTWVSIRITYGDYPGGGDGDE